MEGKGGTDSEEMVKNDEIEAQSSEEASVPLLLD